MDIDPTEHFDGDGDGVGSNSDYDDTKGFIQTEQDHCLNDKNDTSEACMGWNDPAYQAYLSGVGEGGIVCRFHGMERIFVVGDEHLQGGRNAALYRC